MNQKNFRQIDISFWTFLKIVIFLVAAWFAYVIRDVLAIFFFAVVLASALYPFVDWLQRHHIPRAFCIILIFTVVFGMLSLALALIIPPLIEQARELVRVFPFYLAKASEGFQLLRSYSNQYGISSDINSMVQSIAQFFAQRTNVFSFLSSIVGGIVSFVVMLVITFYLLLEQDAIRKTFYFVAPTAYQPYIAQTFHRIQTKIGLWLRGQLILSFIIGCMVLVGLSVLRVPYALVLALFAAIAEFIPYVGPTLAAIPAIFLAFVISPILAIFVLCFYIVIQQIENHFLVPKVMQRTIGLNPIISIISLMIGAKLGGLAGVALAIPVATAVSVVVIDFFDRREAMEKRAEKR